MNTYHMNIDYGKRIKVKQTATSTSLNIIHKTLVVICVYLVFGLLFQYVCAENTFEPYQSQHGAVWLLPDNGIYLEAMQMKTDVDYEISGSIARARIKQQFKNSSEFWAEGIYVFPLPEKAAVDQFRMIIGGRIIEGQVKERTSAKRTYEKAKVAGKKTSLFEQQRPNVFTTSLANIAPGEEITVEFEYQQVLDYRDNSYRLRFPMVTGPRYHAASSSPQSLPDSTATNTGTSVYTETDLIKGSNNPTRIHIMLDAGINLAELKSTYHQININQTSETRYSISTVGENIISNRDFELVWNPKLQDEPQLTAFSEEVNGKNYAMVTLFPPDLSYLQQKVQARDIIFVLDISGSMAGTSIEQAKASLITALDGLGSIDRFNIIWFNNETDKLFPKSVRASAQYKNYAKLFVQQLHANGGTEMLAALKLALSGQEKFSRFRQVVFLTDGNIDNETELFGLIDKQLGNSRLFTIGIGSAPNSYFMRKAANKGRGTFTYIGDINEVQDKTIALFKKLETPALINLQLTISPDVSNHEINNPDINNQSHIEIFPEILPDLYAGEPLSLLFKTDRMPKKITLQGDYGHTEWQSSAALTPASHSGIRIAWAGEKISSLMSLHGESPDDKKRETIKKEITDTALEHHLVSRFTSLVAVDVTPSNANGLLYRERMKNNLPYGWKASPQSGDMMLMQLSLPQTASSSRFNLLVAIFLFFTGILIFRWKKYHAIKNINR
jgi:Ca-activated chloride channel family protein